MTKPDNERAKYEEAWDQAGYRDAPSHGLGYWPCFLSRTKGQRGPVALYGCGQAYVAHLMIAEGFGPIYAIDIADNAVEGVSFAQGVRVVTADLRTPDAYPATTDWAWCTDVLEHLAEAELPNVLRRIHNATRYGVFFLIALCFDKSGAGTPNTRDLHRTVRPISWWMRLLREYWGNVERVAEGNLTLWCEGRP